MFLSCISGRSPLLNTFGTKMLHVHVIIFILQHFDWVLSLILECDWMNYFQSCDIIIVKKNFECVLGYSKNSSQCSYNL